MVEPCAVSSVRGNETRDILSMATRARVNVKEQDMCWIYNAMSMLRSTLSITITKIRGEGM
jgi:hypothetical protein